ncbi:hypothetical protein FRC17_009809, partial [Serendipita sp. 399]
MARGYQAFKQYEPSEAAAIIFAVLFGLLLVAHIWQSARAKTYYLWPLILATALECVGYILRYSPVSSADNQAHSEPPESIRSITEQRRHRQSLDKVADPSQSSVFIIVAPACLAAALGRIMLQVGAVLSIMRPSWITPIFVGFDVLSIGLQSIGAALLFNTEDNLDKLKKARTILIAGLLIQIIAFAVFLLLAGWFDRRVTKTLPRKAAFVRILMIAFYITGTLIMIRSIYRAIEFITVDFNARPPKGYFFNVEWAYYVLDALPIAITTGVYNIIYPAKYLRDDGEDSNAKEVQVIRHASPPETRDPPQFEPNEVAAIIFIVIFGLLLGGHMWQSWRAKASRSYDTPGSADIDAGQILYMWPLIFATAMEFVGYILREYCIKNRHEKTPYILSQVFVIIAPACLAAVLYMLVGRAMVYVGPGYSIMRPSWITPTFVTLDVISIATQGIGGGVIFGDTTSLDRLKIGRVILILGLFIQLVAFAIFLFFAVWFDITTTRSLKEK